MKKKLLLSLILVIVLTCPFACAPGDELPDRLYLDSLSIKGENPIILTGDGKVYIEFRPDLDFTTITALGKPTWVTRGVFGGFSLPIYVGGQNEELFFDICAPNRWDEASDAYAHIHCFLDTANTDKNFNLEVAWNYFTKFEDVVPDTVYTITVEVNTGTAAQYQAYQMDLPIDYDIRPDDPLKWDDNMGFRLRRVDASADEITGEIVVTHFGLVFLRDKLGSSAP